MHPTGSAAPGLPPKNFRSSQHCKGGAGGAWDVENRQLISISGASMSDPNFSKTRMLKTIFRMLEANLTLLKANFKVLKLDNTKIITDCSIRFTGYIISSVLAFGN